MPPRSTPPAPGKPRRRPTPPMSGAWIWMVIGLAVVAMLCEGHVLLEDVPGSGKTMLARSVAASLGISFKRIQCTPDLLPNDVTGVSVFNQKSGEFEFRPGPIFVNILLADEINRATPRTQSALLEAMQEQQVTVDGVTRDDEIYSTETFGPIIGVATFSDFDEAMELANGHGYGLSSAVYTNDPKSAFRFRERVTAGMVSVNNSTSGAEAHLPFGGNGKSGNGSRQSGIWVLEQFTRWQSMNWDYAGKLQKAQMEVAEISGDAGYRLAWPSQVSR